MDFGLLHIRTQIYFEMKPIDIFLITVIWLTRNTLTNLLITYWLNLFVKFCFCTRHSPFCVMFCFDSESVARYWFDIVWYELQRYEIKIKKKTCFHLSVTLWYFFFLLLFFFKAKIQQRLLLDILFSQAHDVGSLSEQEMSSYSRISELFFIWTVSAVSLSSVQGVNCNLKVAGTWKLKWGMGKNSHGIKSP